MRSYGAMAMSPGYVFGQRVMERNRTAAEVLKAPCQPDSFRTLSTIDSDSHPVTEPTQPRRIREGHGVIWYRRAPTREIHAAYATLTAEQFHGSG